MKSYDPDDVLDHQIPGLFWLTVMTFYVCIGLALFTIQKRFGG